MKDQQILKAIEDMFQSAGKPLDQDAVKFALRMARDPQFNRVGKAEQLVSSSMAASFLIKAKESPAIQTREQLDQLLQKIRQELPFLLRPGIKAAMKEMSKDLPKKPSTGRDQSLSLEQKKTVCVQVNRLHLQGDSMRAAYQKVGDEWNVSPRTIQRTWRERRDLLGDAGVAMVPVKPTVTKDR